MPDITNYTWSTFRERVGRVWSELTYMVLSDRSAKDHEERLGQWPAVKGELPQGEAVDQIRDLWTWLTHSIGDAAENHLGARVLRLRLRAYGAKGLDVLDQFTLRVELDDEESDEDLDEDLDELPDAVQSASLSQGEQGVNIALRAVAQTHQWQQRSMNRLMLGFRQQQEASAAQLEQLGRTVQSTREDMLALVDILVNDRLEASEAAVKDTRGRRKHASAEPSPVAKQALETIGDLGKTWLSGGLPPSLSTLAKTLANHPKGKELLHDPRLAKLLETPDEIEALVAMLEGVLESVPVSPAAPDAGTGDDPYDYDET